MSAPAIAIHQLGKQFSGTPVLSDLDLEVAPGERVALVGANGAGKTTLIRCLLGEYAHRGALRLGGLAPRQARREALGRVGFVPQIPPPLRMPAGALVRFAGGLGAARPAAIATIAERLGLDLAGVERRPFAKLSGGQQQKLLIALALGRPTDLLVLDEPAANLDPEGRRAFFEILSEQDPATTMVLASHRLDEIAALVSRVVELDGGRVVLDDRVDQRGTGSLRARVVLVRADEAAGRAFASWGLEAVDPRRYEGPVVNADRLRFLGLLARYAGLIEHLDLGPEDAP